MFTIIKKDLHTKARIGILTTPHREVETPAYIIVGTNAEVRTLSADDVRSAGTQIIIANTYHLMIEPGEDAIAARGGLHGVMGLSDTAIMTDSGGFQVFSMGWGRVYGFKKIGYFPKGQDPKPSLEENRVTITEEGAGFFDEKKRERVLLTPEHSIKIQEKLGADIIYSLDECTSPFHDYEYSKASLARTHRWALRCLQAHSKKGQKLWGIVQGGHFKDLREEGARFVALQHFDGIGIGGPLGAAKENMHEIVNWVVPLLPENKVRHMLGIGAPLDILNCVERGMDIFDCVIPTREARHGKLWTHTTTLDIKHARFKNDDAPIEKGCACETCTTISRHALRELFKAKDLRAGRYATIHNVTFFNTFMREIREAINNEKFLKFKSAFISSWDTGDRER